MMFAMMRFVEVIRGCYKHCGGNEDNYESHDGNYCCQGDDNDGSDDGSHRDALS